MQSVELPDGLYQEVARRARDHGFASTDAYIADLLRHDLVGADVPDEFFTPEIIAQLDAAAVEADRGRLVTFEELESRISKAKAEWLARNHG